LLDYLVECGVCSKESFVYITRIIFARRKQVCACAHKIMKRVHRARRVILSLVHDDAVYTLKQNAAREKLSCSRLCRG